MNYFLLTNRIYLKWRNHLCKEIFRVSPFIKVVCIVATFIDGFTPVLNAYIF